jgi:hypothetical protein
VRGRRRHRLCPFCTHNGAGSGETGAECSGVCVRVRVCGECVRFCENTVRMGKRLVKRLSEPADVQTGVLLVEECAQTAQKRSARRAQSGCAIVQYALQSGPYRIVHTEQQHNSTAAPQVISTQTERGTARGEGRGVWTRAIEEEGERTF